MIISVMDNTMHCSLITRQTTILLYSPISARISAKLSSMSRSSDDDDEDSAGAGGSGGKSPGSGERSADLAGDASLLSAPVGTRSDRVSSTCTCTWGSAGAAAAFSHRNASFTLVHLETFPLGATAPATERRFWFLGCCDGKRCCLGSGARLPAADSRCAAALASAFSSSMPTDLDRSRCGRRSNVCRILELPANFVLLLVLDGLSSLSRGGEGVSSVADECRCLVRGWVLASTATAGCWSCLCISWRFFSSSRYWTRRWSREFCSRRSPNCSISLQRLSRWSRPTLPPVEESPNWEVERRKMGWCGVGASGGNVLVMEAAALA